MTYLYIILQVKPEFNNYEDLGLKSILASFCLMFIIAIIYLYYSNNKKLNEQNAKYEEFIKTRDSDIKEKEKKIAELQNSRIEDLKKFTEKYEQMAEKNFTHLQQMSSFVRNSNEI